MTGDYHARRAENLRRILAAILDEMHPRSVFDDEYAADMSRLHRGDAKEQRNWRETPRTFGTCLECLGEGVVPNDAWQDDDRGLPEALDCTTCMGCGIVEIIDRPPPAPPPGDDDLPF